LALTCTKDNKASRPNEKDKKQKQHVHRKRESRRMVVHVANDHPRFDRGIFAVPIGAGQEETVPDSHVGASAPMPRSACCDQWARFPQLWRSLKRELCNCTEIGAESSENVDLDCNSTK
jgi:hypothetical protein